MTGTSFPRLLPYDDKVAALAEAADSPLEGGSPDAHLDVAVLDAARSFGELLVVAGGPGGHRHQ